MANEKWRLSHERMRREIDRIAERLVDEAPSVELVDRLGKQNRTPKPSPALVEADLDEMWDNLPV